mmetsp:Transcript_13710/g.18767  ORF Transcript_13710/g.18767 Transcript_13710/m.18767 type:complete len:87 (+) Transcript_13710:96-356(+)
MCRLCRENVETKLMDNRIERVHRVQLLKEKWAKEKEHKVQQFKERKEAELRKVQLECQQAVVFKGSQFKSSGKLKSLSCDRSTLQA